MDMDRAQLADFLRTRREALRPEDVGLPGTQRRRTSGLRREEVAQLVGMSTDYYGRLEQSRSRQPSLQMLQAIARGLHLTRAERDHLFRLSGYPVPDRRADIDHVAPGLQRIIDRLQDTPAAIIGETGETLLQTPLGAALLGDSTRLTGLARSNVYRWFLDPESRNIYHPDDHQAHGRVWVSDLRSAYARGGAGSHAAELVNALTEASDEFRTLWTQHDVSEPHMRTKRFVHPEVGHLSLDCETLLDNDTQQRLLVFTATPGSDSAGKLALLRVIGTTFARIP